MVLKAQGTWGCIREPRHLHNQEWAWRKMSLQEPTACRMEDKTSCGLETWEDGYGHAGTSKSLCVWSPGQHMSLGTCAERDLEASGTAGRSTFTIEVGMELRPGALATTRPSHLLVIHFQYQPEEQRRCEIIHKVGLRAFLSLCGAGLPKSLKCQHISLSCRGKLFIEQLF